MSSQDHHLSILGPETTIKEQQLLILSEWSCCKVQGPKGEPRKRGQEMKERLCVSRRLPPPTEVMGLILDDTCETLRLTCVYVCVCVHACTRMCVHMYMYV